MRTLIARNRLRSGDADTGATAGRWSTAFRTAALSALLAFGPARATHAETFYIDEGTDFTGNGCPNLADLNTITSTLKTALTTDGWSGSRYTNASSWPQDFMEACNASFGAGGLDTTFTDTSTSLGKLAVYAGHGNAGLLAFGFPHNGVCLSDFSSNMRLGSMSGAQAFAGMWLTSCTLRTCSLAVEANFQWFRQQFGYHNSPNIGSNQPRDFFNGTSANSNIGKWLTIMEDMPGSSSDNSPVAVTYGSSAQDIAGHIFDRMKGGVGVTPRGGGPACQGGQPLFFFQVDMIDNGTSAICGCGT